MKAKEIQIIPTGKEGNEGFNEAIIILDGGKGHLIDSFTIVPSTNIHFDFEIKVETTAKTAIRLWKDNNEPFEVSLSYGPVIR